MITSECPNSGVGQPNLLTVLADSKRILVDSQENQCCSTPDIGNGTYY